MLPLKYATVHIDHNVVLDWSDRWQTGDSWVRRYTLASDRRHRICTEQLHAECLHVCVIRSVRQSVRSFSPLLSLLVLLLFLPLVGMIPREFKN